MIKVATICISLLLIGAAILLGVDWDPLYESIILPLKERPFFGPAVFITLYIASCVLLLPGAILTAAAGLVFGTIKGILCVSTGATLGAIISFLLGKYFFRERVQAYMSTRAELRALNTAVSREAVKVLLLARLCPLVPFRISNYLFGSMSIPLGTYAFTTWLGTLPSASVYVTLGAMAANFAELQQRSAGPWEWALYISGAIILIVWLSFITRTARRELQRETRKSAEQTQAI